MVRANLFIRIFGRVFDISYPPDAVRRAEVHVLDNKHVEFEGQVRSRRLHAWRLPLCLHVLQSLLRSQNYHEFQSVL